MNQFPAILNECILLDGYSEKYPLKTIYTTGACREPKNTYSITLFFEKKSEVESFMEFYINTIKRNEAFLISLPLSHDMTHYASKYVRITNEVEVTPLSVWHQRQVSLELIEV